MTTGNQLGLNWVSQSRGNDVMNQRIEQFEDAVRDLFKIPQLKGMENEACDVLVTIAEENRPDPFKKVVESAYANVDVPEDKSAVKSGYGKVSPSIRAQQIDVIVEKVADLGGRAQMIQLTSCFPALRALHPHDLPNETKLLMSRVMTAVRMGKLTTESEKVVPLPDGRYDANSYVSLFDFVAIPRKAEIAVPLVNNGVGGAPGTASATSADTAITSDIANDAVNARGNGSQSLHLNGSQRESSTSFQADHNSASAGQ